jgi:glycosyltransferase involved in cell wall biosynthesis
MIKILRPVRETPFISADVFEKLFIKHLGHIFDIRREALITWCNSILGASEAPYPFQQSAHNFYQATKDFDYFCPAYECIQLAPLLIALRNHSRSDIRLLFITHAPGLYSMEWVLLRPLLAPGDLIIAPSQSARQILEVLCPELSPFIRVIHHPIEILPACPPENPDIPRLVTLGRIAETKLIHRQIEAMAILRERGYANLRMDIAGALTVGDDPAREFTQYARALQSKIRRLQLDQSVHLVGPIIGDHQKTKFLAGARTSINLSISLEEAFPKASVEPLGLGIPVIATQWDGFVETIGPAGKLVPVVEVADGVLDVDAQDVAHAIEDVLHNPPSAESCRCQAEKFIPAVISPQYQAVLQAGMEARPSQAVAADPFAYQGNASESQGILGKIAVLSCFSWKELLEFHLDFSKKIRQAWEGKDSQELYPGEILQNLLTISTKTPIDYVYAGKNDPKWTESSGEHDQDEPTPLDFVAKIAYAIRTPAILSSKEACLASLSRGKQTDLLAASLEFLNNHQESVRGRRYYEIELDYLRQQYVTAYERFSKAHPVDSIQEHEGYLLKQLAKICRKWKRPELALPWLRRWVKMYPDSPESGFIWLDLAVNGSAVREGDIAEAQAALQHAKELLGDVPVIAKLEYTIALQTLCH